MPPRPSTVRWVPGLVAIGTALVVVAGCGGERRARGGDDAGAGTDGGTVDSGPLPDGATASDGGGTGTDAGRGTDGGAAADGGGTGTDGGGTGTDAGVPPGESCPGTERLGVRDAVRFDSDGTTRNLAVAANASGAVAVGGYAMGTLTFGSTTLSGGDDLFVVKLDTDLSVDWVWSAEATAGSISSVAVGPGGEIYAAGSAEGSVDFGGGATTTDAWFLLKLTSDGSFDRVEVLPGGSSSGVRSVLDLHVAGSGLAVLLQIWDGADLGMGSIATTGLVDFVVARYSTSFVLTQQNRFGRGPTAETRAHIDVDEAGEILFAYDFLESLSSMAVHATKLRVDGSVRWTHTWTSSDDPRSIDDVALSDDGRAFFVFGGRGTFDFGAGPLMFNAILLELDAAGDYVMAREQLYGETLVIDDLHRPTLVASQALIGVPCRLGPSVSSERRLLMLRHGPSGGTLDGSVLLRGVAPGRQGLGAWAGGRVPGGPSVIFGISLAEDIDLGTGSLAGDSVDPVVLILDLP